MMVHFAMLAKRAMPRLLRAWDVRDESVAGLPHAALRELVAMKNAAAQDIAVFEPMLFPAD